MNAGDIGAATGLFAPEIVWEGVFQTFEGRAVARGFVQDWIEAYDEFELVPEGVRDLGGVGLRCVHPARQAARRHRLGSAPGRTETSVVAFISQAHQHVAVAGPGSAPADDWSNPRDKTSVPRARRNARSAKVPMTDFPGRRRITQMAAVRGTRKRMMRT